MVRIVVTLEIHFPEEAVMSGGVAGFACCDRCAGLATGSLPGRTDDAQPGRDGRYGTATAGPVSVARAGRRRLLKAAVFRPSAGRQADASDERAGFADSSRLPRAVAGIVEDVSPHVLVLGDTAREQRFTLLPGAVTWRGKATEPTALRAGDHAVVRIRPSGRNVADRIWANIGRVTGIIVQRAGETLLVDEGATRKPQTVVLRPGSQGRIMVRFPILEPGYLIDVIGTRRGDEVIALVPATSQPGYPAHRLPAQPLISGRVPDAISGSATWHEPRDEPPGVLGVSYPALDPEAGCAEDLASATQQGVSRMPYLSIGSILRIRNDCNNTDCLVPVTGCAPIARLFNDRCVTCGTSPRVRVADLSMASFIALGGELERACFNATITIGE